MGRFARFLVGFGGFSRLGRCCALADGRLVAVGDGIVVFGAR